MQVIDFHTHIYPEKVAAKATANICDFYGLQSDLVGTSDLLLRKGRQAGIDRFVLLPVILKPEQTRHINEFILGEFTAHKEFIGFGGLHPDAADLPGEADFLIKNGFCGIKLHPDTQQFSIDDERMFPVYDYLQDKLPILIHCGDRRFDYSHPARLKRVLERFPRLTVIAAHLGGWTMFDTASEYLKNTNCYFDLSSCLSAQTPQLLMHYIRQYGAERILFGTDFPVWDPITEKAAFDRLPLRSREREKILGGNAAELLGIE